MGSLGIITVLKPHFGYKPCANIAREGFLTGKSLHELIVDERRCSRRNSGTRSSRTTT